MHSRDGDDDSNTTLTSLASNHNNDNDADIGDSWRRGKYNLQRIRDDPGQGSRTNFCYCLQCDDNKIVAGSKDSTIKFWDRSTLECTRVLRGHSGSVLCLQYDDKVLITGSSDSTVS